MNILIQRGEILFTPHRVLPEAPLPDGLLALLPEEVKEERTTWHIHTDVGWHEARSVPNWWVGHNAPYFRSR